MCRHHRIEQEDFEEDNNAKEHNQSLANQLNKGEWAAVRQHVSQEIHKDDAQHIKRGHYPVMQLEGVSGGRR